jgi:signal transduction histidine kinase
MQSLGVMASGIAHDLNNQLLGMIGNAELLLRHIPDTDPLHANLVEITTAAHKTAKLTDNLLVYANTAPRERQVVSIEKLIQRAMSRLDVSIRRKFELRINAEPSILGQVSDPVEIEQAIQNLVINAAEAIKLAGRKHGQVHIDVCQVQVGEGSGTRLAIGPYAEIIVKDNGNGISAEALPFVFDPFFSSKLPGRGLGLAVAHSAMLMNGGLIQVRSQQGSGSEFRILLPAAAQKLQGDELETVNQSELDWLIRSCGPVHPKSRPHVI